MRAIGDDACEVARHYGSTTFFANPAGVKFGMDDEKSALRIAAGMATRRYGEE